MQALLQSVSFADDCCEDEAYILAQAAFGDELNKWKVLASEAMIIAKAAQENLWQRWAQQAMNNGARAAHRYTKVEATAATVLDDDFGRPSALPLDILKYEVNKWRRIWGAKTVPTFSRSCPCLPSVLPSRGFGDEAATDYIYTPAAIRAATGVFSAQTAWGADGFHVRHFGLLTDEALQVLGDLLHVTSATGISPAATSFVTCPLLPKKTGGHRVIGFFPAYQRLYMKLHVDRMRTWEQQWAADVFLGAGARRAPHGRGMECRGSC